MTPQDAGRDESGDPSVNVLPPGTQLEAGGVYLDLNDQQRRPFKALDGQVAGTGNRYVARRDLDQASWNRLVEDVSPIDTTTTS